MRSVGPTGTRDDPERFPPARPGSPASLAGRGSAVPPAVAAPRSEAAVMRPKLTGSGIITAKQLKGAVVVASMRVQTRRSARWRRSRVVAHSRGRGGGSGRLRALCGRPGGCNAYLPPLPPTTPLPGGGSDDVTTGDRHCYAHPMCILPSGALGFERDFSWHRPRSAWACVNVRRHSGGAKMSGGTRSPCLSAAIRSAALQAPRPARVHLELGPA
jgi:hypothetical protein